MLLTKKDPNCDIVGTEGYFWLLKWRLKISSFWTSGCEWRKFRTKHKHFGIKIYILCGMTGYMYGMEVCLGKDRTRATASVATHYSKMLDKKAGHGHKLFLSWLIWLKRKSTVVEQYNLRQRECYVMWPTKWLKHGDIGSRTRDELMAMVCRDKWHMCILTKIYSPPATEGNLCDEHGNVLKLQIVQDYNQHNRIFWQRWQNDRQLLSPVADMKVHKKLFLYLLDFTIINSFFLLTSFDAKMKRRSFWLALVWNLFENAGNLPCFPCPIGNLAIIGQFIPA
jgi:hypothetical protein